MYVSVINGKRHEVEVVDGKSVYDPPLDDSSVARGKQNIKDICKSRKCPGLRSDTTSFHAGRGTLLQQMDGDEVYTKILVDKARKQGYNPGANDVYIGQLADTCGEPKAWFKPDEGRAEFKRRIIASGKGCEMPGLSIEAKPKQVARKALNPRITRTFAKQYAEAGTPMTREQIEKKHGRPVDA